MILSKSTITDSKNDLNRFLKQCKLCFILYVNYFIGEYGYYFQKVKVTDYSFSMWMTKLVFQEGVSAFALPIGRIKQASSSKLFSEPKYPKHGTGQPDQNPKHTPR